VTVLGEHMGTQIPCRNSADPWENQCNKPYKWPLCKVDQAYPFNHQMPNVQCLYMEKELPPLNADLKMRYDKTAG